MMTQKSALRKCPDCLGEGWIQVTLAGYDDETGIPLGVYAGQEVCRTCDGEGSDRMNQNPSLEQSSDWLAGYEAGRTASMLDHRQVRRSVLNEVAARIDLDPEEQLIFDDIRREFDAT